MPISGITITSPSRVMLPAYILHAGWLGLVYTVDPQDRLKGVPGLEFARLLLPMWAWGLMFLCLAVMMATALHLDRPTPLRAALLVYGVAMCVWAVVYAGAPFINPNASLVGPAWALFVAAACKATERSIRNQGR